MAVFTKHRDADREILLRIQSDEELLNICKMENKYIKSLCNEDFFRRRLLNKFPETIKDKSVNVSWRKYYLSMVYYVGKLQEEFSFDFRIGNPEKYYKIFLDRENQMYEVGKNNYIDLFERLNQDYIAEEKVEGVDIKFSDEIHSTIFGAAEYDHKSFLTYLLKLTNYDLQYLNTALRGASLDGNKELIEILLELGGDINEGLNWAIRGNHIDILNDLIKRGANNWNEALQGAIFVDNKELIEFFISKAGINFNNVLTEAAYKGNKELIDRAIVRGADDLNFALLRAVQGRQSKEFLDYLISLGATDFETPLQWAEYDDNDELIEYFKNLIQNR